MPLRLIATHVAKIAFVTILLFFSTLGLIVVAARQASAYRDLYDKHEKTMQVLYGLEKLAKEQQYQSAEDKFLNNIKTAATQAEKIRSDREYRAFKEKYPNADAYDRELLRIRQHRGNDRVPSASQR